MSRRFVSSVGTALVAAVVSFPALAGQARKAPAKTATWTVSHTPWGDPDLQGVWNDATSTPLSRPGGLSEKQLLTDEEAAEFQRELAYNLTRDRRDGGAQADVNRAYNEHWMDARRHIGSTLRQWLGDSRGHWDGNTLVVETSNFRTDQGVIFQDADPATFRITERFTRVDAQTIHYEFTVEDPHTWTRPWTAMIPWTRIDPAEQMYEYACHEDNYDIVHLLHGARIREKNGETVP